MTYNRFLYNSALYNAGREDAAAVARSIIQAHTGPHIQAVVGSTSGVTFISDFIITEGTETKPPSSFKFPDLRARVQPKQTQTDDIPVSIFGQAFGDLPACVFPSDRIPDLAARIFGLLEADLAATIIGELGEHDLPASITALVANLAGRMTGVLAPILRARIYVQSPGNLGARIHTPLDLLGLINAVQDADLGGVLSSIQFGDLTGQMLGVPTPTLLAFVRVFSQGTADLPASMRFSADFGTLGATINPLLGPNDLPGAINSTGGLYNLIASVRSLIEDAGNLGAHIQTGGELDLGAIIDSLGADNLAASIGMIPVGEKDAFLNTFLQPVTGADLLATIITNNRLADLNASITSLHGTADLNAYLRVSETFVTAILTVTTMASRSLRATIGVPDCEGGSANAVLGATITAQYRGDLGAFLESYITTDLGATVNTSDILFAFDTIDVTFSPYKVHTKTIFNVTDTIPVLFSPFRGGNLGATISTVQNNVSLGASLTATFPLPKFVPAVNVMTAADLRLDKDLNIQEVRLQLEGTLSEYLYVNGIDKAFIRDASTDWKINIRSFKPIAEGLFGDRAANRVCRLGSLETFSTLDQAVRSCIDAVIGPSSEDNLGATISVSGQLHNLLATMDVSSNFTDLGGIANRVFPADLGYNTITATGGYQPLSAVILVSASDTASLGAAVAIDGDGDLGAITEW